MNSGTVKISTVHSFKGWESETLFLIIEKKFSGMAQTFDEILYTGLTRSRNNLVIIPGIICALKNATIIFVVKDQVTNGL